MDLESQCHFRPRSLHKPMCQLDGSKKEEEVDQVDQISDLPDHIIGLILSDIPLIEAMGTSILSSRWRYLWHGITSICISIGHGLRDDKFANFVDYVLQKCHSKEFVKFSIFSYKFTDWPRANKWVCYGIKHTIGKLYLHFYQDDMDPPEPPFPLILLCPSNLEALELKSYFDIQMPDSVVCFPRLKFLRLRIISPFQDQAMYRLLSCCPVLEELYLCYFCNFSEAWTLEISIPTLKSLSLWLDCNCYETDQQLKVVLDTPKLEYLSIVRDDLYAQYMVKEMSYLRVASVNCMDISSEEEVHEYVPTLFQFLNRISATRILTLRCAILDVLASAAARSFAWPSFPSLFVLIAHLSAFSGWSCLPNVLHAAPCLGVLILDMELMNDFSDSIDDIDDRNGGHGWTPPNSVPRCMLSHLKKIGIKCFGGYKGEMKPVKYLLSNCHALETMVVGFYPNSVKEKVAQKLLRLPRASQICDVKVCNRFSFKTHSTPSETGFEFCID